VATADSAETDDESAPASAAIDGDNATYWHSSWEPGGGGDAVLPHELLIDLVTTQPITGFAYLPRQDSANGRIADWAFYVSKDGVAWGAPLKTGTFATGTALQKIVW
jgi:phospholipase C